MVRMPEGMRDKLKELASYSGRSTNAEIVDRLDKSLRRSFFLEIPESTLNRGRGLPVGALDDVMNDISMFAVQAIENAADRHENSKQNLINLFSQMLQDRPKAEQEALSDEFAELLKRAGLDGEQAQ